jgi:hypothetical protein
MGLFFESGFEFEGLARPRKVVEGKMLDASEVALEHFLKIVLFDDQWNKAHWYGELKGFIEPLLKLRLKPDRGIPIQIARDCFVDAMEDEEEARDLVVDMLETYPNARLYGDLCDSEGNLRDKWIQSLWIGVVDLICCKLAEKDKSSVLRS